MNTKACKRRTPEKTSFYKIVYNYFEEYKNVYSERYENEYGYFRNIVSDVVERKFSGSFLAWHLFTFLKQKNNLVQVLYCTQESGERIIIRVTKFFDAFGVCPLFFPLPQKSCRTTPCPGVYIFTDHCFLAM